jgi:hypothetical protein
MEAGELTQIVTRQFYRNNLFNKVNQNRGVLSISSSNGKFVTKGNDIVFLVLQETDEGLNCLSTPEG